MAVVGDHLLSELAPAGAPLDGWMDEDAAAAATQLFGSGPRGALVIDARELLTSTARVVGVQLGALHFKTWMAIVTLHVEAGMPDDGKTSTDLSQLTQMIYGSGASRGGNNTVHLIDALYELRHASFTLPGYDVINQRPAAGVSDTNLLISFFAHESILSAYTRQCRLRELSAEDRVKAKLTAGELEEQRAEFGRALGGRRGDTIGWQLHPNYTERLADTDLRRFDWTKAQQLRGVALALWMLFSSERVPYRASFENPGDLEVVDVPLSEEHCHALGVRAATDAARRRTLNQAGKRVCEADRSFIEFAAHGGRGHRASFLRVIRTAGPSSGERRPSPTTAQLSLG